MAKRSSTPGSWKKGQSGNPGGRPKQIVDVQALARQHTPEAIKRLTFWMASDNPKASPMACVALLNRAWGNPVQPNELTGKDGGPILHAIEDNRAPIEDLIGRALAVTKEAEETRH
jgi:hypothetical protein